MAINLYCPYYATLAYRLDTKPNWTHMPASRWALRRQVASARNDHSTLSNQPMRQKSKRGYGLNTVKTEMTLNAISFHDNCIGSGADLNATWSCGQSLERASPIATAARERDSWKEWDPETWNMVKDRVSWTPTR